MSLFEAQSTLAELARMRGGKTDTSNIPQEEIDALFAETRAQEKRPN